MSASCSLTLTNELPELARLSEAVEDFGEVNAMSPKDIFQINLALDEVITNIISYAYEDSACHEIDVTFELAGSKLLITVSDDGRLFNPLHMPPPDLTASLEEKEMGGLGIHFVRQVMNHVAYEREAGRNKLLLHKELTPR